MSFGFLSTDLSLDQRLPIVVLGGFLGSGKTTLLSERFRRPGTIVVINDLGEVAPDILSIDSEMHLLLGGCACCQRSGEFVHLLRGICEERHRVDDQANVRRVVLETSGLADPARILKLILDDAVLSSNIRVDSVMVTIDGVRGISDLIHEPLAVRQIEQADCIVVTKGDLGSANEIGRLLATVVNLNPTAKLIVTAVGRDQETPGYLASSAVALGQAREVEATTPICYWLSLPDELEWTLLSLWLGALIYSHRDDVLRVKGLVRTPRGPLLVHAARGCMSVPTALEPGRSMDDESGLMFVMRGIDPKTLRRSWELHLMALGGV